MSFSRPDEHSPYETCDCCGAVKICDVRGPYGAHCCCDGCAQTLEREVEQDHHTVTMTVQTAMLSGVAQMAGGRV